MKSGIFVSEGSSTPGLYSFPFLRLTRRLTFFIAVLSLSTQLNASIDSIKLVTSTNTICYDSCNGFAMLEIYSGTTGPFQVVWKGGILPASGVTSTVAAGDTIIDLCSGDYSIEVTDLSDMKKFFPRYFTIARAGIVAVNYSIAKPTCFDSLNGSVVALPYGGKSPYHFKWSTGPADTLATLGDIGSGVYGLTVTDSNGCKYQDSVIITAPGKLLVNISGSDVLCNGDCNGRAISIPSGGSSPFTFLWSSSGTANEITNLCPGNFIVTVTDFNNCQAVDSVLISQPAVLNSNFSVQNASCNNLCNGQVMSSTTGGKKPYSFHWSGSIDQDSVLGNACAGVITYTVTDANGCFKSSNVTISEPGPLAVQPIVTPSACGTCNGNIVVNASGGSGSAYGYFWIGQAPEDTINTIDSLCPGLYNIAITDSLLCSDTFSIALSDDTSGIKDLLINTVPATCSNSCDASASAKAIGGDAPYTYTWMPGNISDSVLTNKCGGNYFIEAEDATGCKRVEQVILDAPDAINIAWNAIFNSCRGDCNGQIGLSVAGGNPPFSYQWTGSPSTGSTAGSLCAGNYPVKVTDAAGCTAIDTASLSQPDSINIVISPVNSTCDGICNGSATIVISGGQSPYIIRWGNGSKTAAAGNLCAGTHWVEVEDGLHCIRRKSFTVSAPSPIAANAVIYNSDCGVNNGSIKLNPSGGTGPYSFLWFNNTKSDSVYGLNVNSTGPYTVATTDASGCTVTDSFIISSKNGPQVNYSVAHESCHGDCDGSISMSVPSPGTSYSFVWIPNPAGPSSSTISSTSGLCPGTYYAGVKDNSVSNCTSISVVEIKEAPKISVNFDYIQPSCNGSCDGSVIASISGGLPPYNIAWSNGPATAVNSGICGGSYTITITDASSCSISADAVLDDPPAINISLSTSSLTCYDVCDGSITSMVSGGNAPYLYHWSNGSTGPDNSSLCPGNYDVTVTDQNGCMATSGIAIGNGVPISASFTSVLPACGLGNGSLTASPSGGNGMPYFFSWSNGDTVASATGLPAGIYNLIIRDNMGCETSLSAPLGNSGGPSLTDNSYPVSCFGECDGAAKTIASGGNGPYSYRWYMPGMPVDDSVSSLCGGLYYYSVSDSAACISFDSVVIEEAGKLIIQSAVVQPISCPGDSDGVLLASASGGISPYQFAWSNGDSAATADSLNQGIYIATVVDSAGCQATDTVPVNNPSSISTSLSATATSCFGSCSGMIQASVSGGTPPYSYAWDDPANQTSPIASGLCPGYTTLILTDAAGCSDSDSALVASPSGISAAPTPSNPTCHDGSNGSISLVISGGTPPYTVTWNNGMTGPTASGLAAGTYGVVIVDKLNCVFQNSYILNNPAPLNITVNVTKPSCGNSNGSASAIVSGGSGSYSFHWNTVPPKTTSSVTALWSGVYELRVTDNNTSCVTFKTVIVNDNSTIVHTTDATGETCPGICDGSAKVSDGPQAYQYLWDDALAQDDSIASDLCPGFYTVMIYDTSTSCVAFDTVTVKPSLKSIELVSLNRVSCEGECDGSASVVTKNTIPPIAYSWNTIPVQTNATAVDLCGGTYIASASDSSLCNLRAIVNIEEPEEIDVGLELLSGTTCYESCDGRASVSPSGGIPPYIIYWNGIAGGTVVFDLCKGTNTVEVSDHNGCSVTLSFEVDSASPVTDNAVLTFPDCGKYNGKIVLNPGGGRGPYFYTWSTGLFASQATGLFAGIYSVDITDANGCTSAFTYFLNNPNAPALGFDNNSVKCNGDCNGVARVNPVGGVGPYSYLWNHVPVSTTDSLTGLCAGIYFVKVSDALSCLAFGADTVSEPDLLTGNITKITDGCGGQCLGEATILPGGGTIPYSYNWNSSPPQTTATASGLCAGTVQVTITDANNCIYADSLTIVPPAELVLDSLIVINTSCFTNTDGKATVYTHGGTLPVSYLWSDSQTGQTAGGLGNGMLSVVVSDMNGCLVFDTAEVGVEDTVLVSFVADSIVCIGTSIELMALGTGADSYHWFEDSSGTLKSIGSGDSLNYSVLDSVLIILRGENSASPPCYDIDSFFIIGVTPPPVTASAGTTTIEEGNSVQLQASPYLFNGHYAWSPSISLNDTASISPLASPIQTTTYFVTGTDINGCSGSDSITITVIENKEIINGFSPNGDGVNDTWEIPILAEYPDAIVEVYNRWGQQVFRSEGYEKPWDGRFEGSLLPNASYYYVIDLLGDGSKVETGAVTLMY